MATMDLERMARPLPPTQGAVIAINCNATGGTPTVIDLTSVARSLAADPGAQQPDQQNPVGHYIRIVADAGNVYFATGSNATTLAQCTTTAYANVAANGTVSSIANCMSMISNGRYQDFLVTPGGTMQTQSPPGGQSPCRYVALLGSVANTIARIHQRST